MSLLRVHQWKPDVGAALNDWLLIGFKEAALSGEIAYDHAAKAQVCGLQGDSWMSTDTKTQFNLLTRKIIELLVSACPAAIKITGETFELPKGKMEEVSISGLFASGFYSESPEEEFLGSTLRWLQDEGYIRSPASDHYVATLKALTLAGAIPNALS
jgi:hypothetical protein